MTKFYDACVVESSYEKDGKSKNNYRKIGVVIQHKDGKMSLKLDRFFNPLGALNKDRECWITFFEQKSEASEQSQNGTQQNAGFSEPSLKSDDMPW